jgi:hypothetical protein
LYPEPEWDSGLIIRSPLKKRILFPDRGGVEFKTAGNLLVVEDLKRGTNKEMGPKDIFGMASGEAIQSPGKFELIDLV